MVTVLTGLGAAVGTKGKPEDEVNDPGSVLDILSPH